MGLNSVLGVIARSNLRDLDISHNSIEVEECSIISQILSTESKLATLTLSNNNIGEDGAFYIAEGLRANKGLEALDISHTAMNGAAGRMIFRALQNHPTLKHLDISNNNFGDEGALELAALLKTNNNILETLIVSMNSIESDGSAAIMESLLYNRHLKKFYYGPGNYLLGDSATSLGNALRAPESGLIKLDISGCVMSRSGILFLGKSLIPNIGLKELIMKGNDLSKVAIPFIADISENKYLT